MGSHLLCLVLAKVAQRRPGQHVAGNDSCRHRLSVPHEVEDDVLLASGECDVTAAGAGGRRGGRDDGDDASAGNGNTSGNAAE
ncbi:hypothetical protein MBOT_00210 [Mycobacterium botniense]|uniref:Uncharacterized protein n=1 Tax=Mycobacterium botniense TaxID=84962 RepID=A0A7I9XTH0_9MYCO|nr:hypothetical protein MBOT_00210 [Mycobacterium botniense]